MRKTIFWDIYVRIKICCFILIILSAIYTCEGCNNENASNIDSSVSRPNSSIIVSTPTPTPIPTKILTPIPTKIPTPIPTKAPTKIPTKTPTRIPEKSIITRSVKSSLILAEAILSDKNIDLATIHVSGVKDHASAYNNIYSTSQGYPADRSRYGTAPGGYIDLNPKMLKLILLLADKYNYKISEISGGSHSSGSKHYSGIAFDVVRINGTIARKNCSYAKAFVADAGKFGATGSIIENSCIHIECN
ncbi:MAG: hypothetical protein ACYCYI_10095 [Saccharofermentanales bacterium]